MPAFRVPALPPTLASPSRLGPISGPRRRPGAQGRRRRSQVLVASVLGLLALALIFPSSASAAKKMTLAELMDFAHTHSPTLRASDAATQAMAAQEIEAHRYWLPSGELTSFVTALPKIECDSSTVTPPIDPDTGKSIRQDVCIHTTHNPQTKPFEAITSLAGVFWRTELKLVQPIWDFGKIAAGVEAAQAGVAAFRQKGAIYRAEIDAQLSKAYWGLKYAREARSMLEEGEGYIDEAQKKVDKDLAEGKGDTTVSDRLRLRTVRAEVEVRLLEAKRQERVALSGLHALLGPQAPADLDVDDADFEALELADKPVDYYEDQALHLRPEAQALQSAAKAKHALAELEQRKLYPDLALVGTAAYAYAPTVDSPNNAYLNNPFNTRSFGLVAALRVPLDFGPKLARADRMRAEADESALRQEEAWQGIRFEVEKAFAELSEAQTRLEEVRKGEKAGKAWVAAVSQNFGVGLAEAKDLSDALLQYFKMRGFSLQATFDVNVAAATLARVSGTPIGAPPAPPSVSTR